MTPVASVIALTVMWVVLWGQADIRSVVGGLVVGTLLVLTVPTRDRAHFDAFRPLQLVEFLIRYAWQVVASNAIVAWEIITPGSRVREGIVAVQIIGASDAVVNMLAHVISGTPGTLIIEIQRGEKTILYVHVLHLRDVERVRRDVLELERLLIRAIGSPESLVDIEARLAEHRAAHPFGRKGRAS